jgi:hypothetical protein
VVGQRRAQGPGRIIEARGAAEIQHAQLFDTRLALLADQLATTHHVNADFNLKIRRIYRAPKYPEQAQHHTCNHGPIPWQGTFG